MMQQNLSLMNFFVKQHLHAGHSELGVVIKVMTKTPVLLRKHILERRIVLKTEKCQPDIP